MKFAGPLGIPGKSISRKDNADFQLHGLFALKNFCFENSRYSGF